MYSVMVMSYPSAIWMSSCLSVAGMRSVSVVCVPVGCLGGRPVLGFIGVLPGCIGVAAILCSFVRTV